MRIEPPERKCDVTPDAARHPAAGGSRLILTLHASATTVICQLSLFFLLATASQGQEIAVQRGPYYVGEPVIVQVTVSSDGNSTPDCRYAGDSQAALQVAGPDVGQNTMSSMRIINGRMSREDRTDYKFTFQITANKVGAYTVGPFSLNHNGQEVELGPVELEFERLADDPDIDVQISFPREEFYVGERVPVEIRWTYRGEMRGVNHAFNALQIRSPLFDQFEFKDKEPTTRQLLTIATAQGQVLVEGKVTESPAGQEAVHVTGTRTMVASQPGEYRNIPVSCRTEIVTKWQRDFFGDVRPVRAKPAVATGEPISFIVKPLPIDSQPATFSGAVGSGYGIEVSAGRTVVRVGDPISLDIRVSGSNLESLSLPDLNSAGLAADQFEIPSRPPVGTVKDTSKNFKVSVRCKTEEISQLPELEFSWFDPVAQQFQTAVSKPIALQVLPAEIVSSDQVVSAMQPSAQPGSPQETPNAATGSSAQTNGGSPLSLVGANLAIEREPTALLGASSLLRGSPVLTIGFYAVGLLLVVASLIARHQNNQDPASARQSRVKLETTRRIQSVKSLPPKEQAEALAGVLRNVLPNCPPDLRPQIETCVAELDTVAYSPEPSRSAQQLDSLAKRVTNLVEQAL